MITQRSASAYNNLSTLYLSGVLEDINSNETILEQGISLKIKFLESEYINDFIILATAENYKTTKKEIQLLFLNQLLFEVEKSGNIYLNTFLDVLIKLDFSAKEDFLNDFVIKPIENITRNIEESKSKRKVNKANSIKAANSLLSDTKDSIKQLKYILGETNIKYNSISDKLAMEIFACGRDYFMHFKETNTDPSDFSIKLFQIAKSYAVGNIIKLQIDENIKDLQEWIDEKPEREKQKLIETDLKSLVEILQTFENRSDTIENAKSLIIQSKPKLNSIKSVLGSSDDLYLKLSTRVAAMAQHNIVEEVNSAQENIEMKITFDRYGTINKLKSTLTNAWTVSTLVGTLDMEYDFKTKRYNTNKESLRGLCSQLGVSTSNYSGSTSSRSSSSTSIPTTNSSSSNTSSSDTSFTDIFPWILAGLGLIIGLANDAGWASLIIAFIALGLGAKIAEWFK